MENYIERLQVIQDNVKLSPSVRERAKVFIQQVQDKDSINTSRRRSYIANFLFEHEPNLKPTSKF